MQTTIHTDKQEIGIWPVLFLLIVLVVFLWLIGER